MTDTSNEARVYLIMKQGFWYRPNSQGYTSSAIQAGRYTLAEAEDITHPNGKDGPRDGMSYVHEDAVVCDDWKAFTAQRAEVARLTAELGEARMQAISDGCQLQEAVERADRAEAALSAAMAAVVDAAAVSEAMEDNGGCWVSCSGCHELNEGVPTGPFSDAMKCHLGIGCRECGGIGAIWDTTDYSDYGSELQSDASAIQPDPAALSHALTQAHVAGMREAAGMLLPGPTSKGGLWAERLAARRAAILNAAAAKESVQ